MPSYNYTDIEREIIVLKAVTDLIDEMVNFEIFEKFERTRDMNMTFRTMTHQRLFNVLLVDMLTRPSKNHFGLPSVPKDASGSVRTFLYFLGQIGENPLLNPSSAVLLEPVEEFATWLDGECIVENVWFPSIDLETTIQMPRMSFIKICGDIAKHCFPRLGTNADRIQELLANNGHEIDIEQAYLAMPDFYQWFHHDIFGYHSSTIAESLNNIRWGIHDYLTPEFTRSYKKTDPNSEAYKFDFPKDCTSRLGNEMYWELMNWVRSKPYMPRFEVTKYLKMGY